MELNQVVMLVCYSPVSRLVFAGATGHQACNKHAFTSPWITSLFLVPLKVIHVRKLLNLSVFYGWSIHCSDSACPVQLYTQNFKPTSKIILQCWTHRMEQAARHASCGASPLNWKQRCLVAHLAHMPNVIPSKRHCFFSQHHNSWNRICFQLY